jgi:Amidohydrolase family
MSSANRKTVRFFLFAGVFFSFAPGPGWGAVTPPVYPGSAGGEEPGKDQSRLAFIHVQVIPMDGDNILLDHTLLIQGDRIVGLGPSDTTDLPEGTAVIDGSGSFLLPGLIDAHVHLDQQIGARPDFGDAPLFLSHGVTSVFNLRGEPQHLDWKRWIQEGGWLAPNLYNAGEFVNEPRVNTAEEAEREVRDQLQAGYDILKFREVIDFKDWRVLTTKGLEKSAYLRLNEAARQAGMPLIGHAPYRVGLAGLLQAGQALAHMNELANLYFLPPLSLRGETFMTVARWSGLALLLFSFLGNAFLLTARVFWRSSNPQATERKRIIHSVNRLLVLAVVCILMWVLVVPPGRLFGRIWLLLLVSGASALYLIEVIRFLLASIRPQSQSPVPLFAKALRLVALIAALGLAAFLIRWVPFAWRGSDGVMNRVARELREAGVRVESTLVLYETGVGVREGFRYEDRIKDPVFRCLPVALQRQWKEIRQMLPSWMVKVWGRHPDFTRKLTASLHRAGVPLMAGTDALGAPFIIPGASLHQELQLLKESGLSPYDVIRTATVEPARFLGKEAEFGSIRTGKRADFILVEGNPLEDLSSLKRLRGVMVRGTWLSREKLAEMLAPMATGPIPDQ